MLYFMENTFGQLIAVTTETGKPAARIICRWDFRSLVDAEVMADKATAFTGKLHIATDAGAHTSPRYDVVAAPVVGDEVSRYFNGDAYPAGKIAKISKTLFKVTTDTGIVFYRVKGTGKWVNNGTWSMVSGHHNDKNPSF